MNCECGCDECRRQMENRMTAVETWVGEMRTNHMPHINQRLDEICKKIDRPTWLALLIISSLVSLVTGLIIHLVSI